MHNPMNAVFADGSLVLSADRADVPSGSPGLVWVLLLSLSSDSARLDAHRGALMELYVDKVLGARERLPPAALDQWAPIAAVLTADDLKVPPVP